MNKALKGNEGIGFIGSQPPFTVGQAISCQVGIRNPTTIAITYALTLSLGSNLIGAFPSVTVQPGASATIGPVSGVAPAAGTYYIYIGGTGNGQALTAQMAGQVVVNTAVIVVPDLQIVSLTWL